MEKVLVIIVTYNAMKWIDRCLGSCEKSSYPVDVFVVDNRSEDETVSHIKNNYSVKMLVESNANMGFGKANNVGLQYALDQHYDYVYLLNQDAWIYAETISQLIKVSKAYPGMGLLSPMQMNGELECIDYNFIQCCPLEMLSDAICGNLKDVYEAYFFMAAHWFMPIETIKKVGGFSPSFPHYGEDHNYIHRIHYMDIKIGIVPKLSVVHDRRYRKDNTSTLLWKAYIRGIVGISNITESLPIQLITQPFSILYQSRRYSFWQGDEKRVTIILAISSAY